MITIIYPFRNRELNRIKNSLDSLANQSNKEFNVLFVDYGSDLEIASVVKELLKKYEFVKYIYSYHISQPWSRSKAINIGLRSTKTEHVFIADIDIIFHSRFIDLLYELKKEKKNFYFQVGYLNESESKELKKFENYTIVSKSIPEGKGLSFFKLDYLLKIDGYDEFFHFWGAEDQDVHFRLQNAGFHSEFYNKEILLLHQWHKIFENLEKKELTQEPLFADIFAFNKQKMRFNQKNKTIVNHANWGELITEQEFQLLNNSSESEMLLNKKKVVENFIDIILPNTKGEVINVVFNDHLYRYSLSYKIKRFLRMKTHDYYSLKEINDMLLKNLIIHYRSYLYTYQVHPDLKSIQLKIKK